MIFTNLKEIKFPYTNLEILQSNLEEIIFSNVATFHIEVEPCLTETKCNCRILGGDDYFWAKQQSYIS